MVSGLLLAALLVSAAPVAQTSTFDTRPFDEDSAKHVATGAAAGTAAMGTCTTYFVLRPKVKQTKSKISTWGCYAVTMGLSGAMYGFKEAYYDPHKYGDGTFDGTSRRDFVEGFGGSAFGALVFVPIATW